jgi:hypothetical protein
MITRRHLLGSLAAVPIAAGPAFADAPAVFMAQGVAIHGVDPVAYFDALGPVAGSHSNRLMWRNAFWLFSSVQNMSLFERDPYRFAPQYGGYCALSLSQGAVSKTQPDAWAIHAGKLYLTHSVVALDRWQKTPDRFIAMADTHWPTALYL